MKKIILALSILSISTSTYAQLTHSSGYFSMFPYSSSYDDGSYAKIFYDGNNKRIQFWNSDGGTQYTSLFTGSIESNGTVKGSLQHLSGYLRIKPYSTSYDDGTETKLYYDGNNKALIFINSDPNTSYSSIQVGNIFSDGKIGIGTSSTGSHKLAVDGSIGAREIKVEASGWSDFVFEKDYELFRKWRIT